jgi:transposase
MTSQWELPSALSTAKQIALLKNNCLSYEPVSGAGKQMYSLLACCKLNKVNPRGWLTDVLKRLPSYPVNRVAELLPHRWARR